MPEPIPPPESLPASPAVRLASSERRLIALVEILLCSSVPTQLLLQVVMLGAGWNPTTPSGGFSLPFVVTLTLADTALLIALMVVLTRAHGESAAELWIGARPVWREAFLGLMLVPAVFVLVVVLLTTLRAFAPWLHNVPTNPLESLAAGGAINAALFGLVAIIAGGLREELQRAFLLRRFEQHLGGVAVGVIVLSAAFGVGHWVQGRDAVITTGALGAFWSVVYLRRRSSVAPIISHAGFNSLEVFRIAVSGV
jgi:uncharacterized protein